MPGIHTKPAARRTSDEFLSGTLGAEAMGMKAYLAALPLVACSMHMDSSTPPPPTLSTEVATHDLYPSTSAQSDGQTLTVYAALLGKGHFVKIAAPDQLGAVIDGAPEQPLTLQPSSGSSPHYSLSVPAKTTETHVIIHLTRANQEVDSIALTVAPAFALGTTPQLIKDKSTVTVQVTPTPTIDQTKTLFERDSWDLYLDGPCVDASVPISGTIQGDSVSWNLSSMVRPKNAASSCAVTMKVQHMTIGKADAVFSQPWPTDVIGVQERRAASQFSY